MRHLLTLLVCILSLPLSAAITGTVLTTDGVPVGGARVSIHALETASARRARLVSATPDAVPLASVQTDETGSFSLTSPKEPVVELRVELRGHEPLARRVERLEEAVVIVLPKTDLVKGRVTAGGKPVPNALVVVGTDYVTRSDEQGHYEAPAMRLPYAIPVAVIHPDYAIDEETLYRGSALAIELHRTLSAGVTLTGRAVAADGTSPVAGAEISVDGWPRAMTGEDGTFRVAHAPADWTVITARKGTLAGSHTAGGASPIRLRLEPSAVISGRLRDAKTNEPVAGAMVNVLMFSGPETAGITDAGGMYSVALPAGAFSVSTAHPSYAWQNALIRIAPGQQLTRDFAVTPLARISGVVLDEGGRPAAAATVAPRDARDRGIPDMPANGALPVKAGSDGKFNVRVLPGHDFYLRVSKPGFPPSRGEVMKLGPGERKSAVALTLPAGIMVTGRALDASGKPLSAVSVTAGPAPAPGARETLETLWPSVQPEAVPSAADGTFALRVKEGWHHFTFQREGYRMAQVRSKNITAAGDNRIEARLDPAVEISGRVTRGGAGVEDVALSSYGATQAHATTAADGSFVLGGFSPGVKKLEVRKPERIDETRNVTAPARGIVIAVPTGGTIRGRVVDKATKLPIRSFRVGVMAGRGNLTPFSSDDGSFTLEHVPAGPNTVGVNAFGYLGAGRKVDVVDGGVVADVVVELEPGTRLTGKVTDANGAPLSGVTVMIIAAALQGGIVAGLDAPRERPVPPGLPNDSATTVTGADGTYTLEGLLPGEESVRFSHPGHAGTMRKVTLRGSETTLDVQMFAVP